jgi:hypothetical protein
MKITQTPKTEKSLQQALWNYRIKQGHKLICPNAQIFIGESDLLSVSLKGFAYTHEIKVSKADFKREFQFDKQTSNKKYFMHEALERIKKTGVITDAWTDRIPSYYLFVCPSNLITADEIPAYAGLLWYDGEGFTKIVNAPRIHAKVLSDRFRTEISNSLMWRYWKLAEKFENNLSANKDSANISV